MNNIRHFSLTELYYGFFIIYVVQSMAFPNSSLSGVIRISTLGLGILCLFTKRHITLNKKKVLVVISGVILLIESYISTSIFRTNSLSTTSGRLTSIATITLCLIIFTILEDINLTSKKINDVFCLFSGVMIIASLFTYNIVGVIDAVVVGRRLGSDFSTINLFGMIMAMMAIFMLHSIILTKRYIVLKTFGLLILTLFVASSGSRASLLCLFIGVLIYLLMTSEKNKVINVIKVAIVLSLLVYFMSFSSFTNSILNRVSTLWRKQDTIVAASDASRMRLIVFGLEQWLKRPLFGYGFNAFTNYSTSVISFNTYSHNNFVEILFNNGIVGLICFYLPRIYVLIALIRLIKKKKDKTTVFLITIMFVLLLSDFTIVSYYYLSLNFIWILGWAYLINYDNTNETEGCL